MNKIGDLITKYRRENHITQKELAEKLGVSNTAVSKWECGNNLPDITMLKPLSEVLKVDILTLLDIQEEIVIEQSTKTKFKLKLLIPICIVVILISLFISIGSILYSKRKIDNLPDPVTIYSIYCEDERLQIDGYVIANSNKTITFINNLFYDDGKIGTNKKFKATNINIKLYIEDMIVYSKEILSTENKPAPISELLSNNELNKNEIIDNDLEKNYIKNNINNSNLIINYYNNTEILAEETFQIKLYKIFE